MAVGKGVIDSAGPSAEAESIWGAWALVRWLLGPLGKRWRLGILSLISLIPKVAVVTVLPLLIEQLIDKGIKDGDTALATKLMGFILGLAALDAVGTLASRYLTAAYAAGVGTDIRLDAFRHLQRLPISFFGRQHIDVLAERCTVQVGVFEDVISEVLPRALVQISIVVIGGYLLFQINSKLAVICVLLLPLVLFGSRFLSRLYDWASQRASEAEDRLLNHAQESLAAQNIVKAYGLEDPHVKEFTRLAYQHSRETRRTGLLGGGIASIVQGTGYLVLGVAMTASAILVLDHQLTIGEMLAFVQLSFGVVVAVQELIGIGLPLKKAAASARPIEELFRTRPALDEGSSAPDLPILAREIRLDDLSLAAGGRQILSNVSAVIPRHSWVAFVGPSGSGKSTILSLLMRLSDSDSGVVSYDDHNLRDYSPASVRRQIGIVFQDTYIFGTSVLENIRISRHDAGRLEVERAARAADIHEFIQSLPDGYDTVLADRGNDLSGGQRQRIGVARAILRDPEILILDEATSGLDPSSEAALNESIRRIAKDRTVITVTHRLAQVVECDHIYILDRGRIVETGRHHELARAGGPYAVLWEKQNGFMVGSDVDDSTIEPQRLRLVQIFAKLSDDALGDLAERFSIDEVAAGKTLIEEGEDGDAFYVLVRGVAEVLKNDEGGEPHRVALLHDGDHFGEVALLERTKRTASIRTVTHCIFAELKSHDFDELLTHQAEVVAAVEDVRRQRAEDESSLSTVDSIPVLEAPMAEVLPVLASDWSVCKPLVDKVWEATGATIAAIAAYNREVDMVSVVVLSGFVGDVMAGFKMLQKVIPGWDPFKVGFPPDVNPYNRKIYVEGELVDVRSKFLVEGTMPAAIFRIACRMVPLDWSLAVPLRLGDTVVGCVEVMTKHRLGADKQEVVRGYARQMEQLLQQPVAGAGAARGDRVA